MSVLTRVEGHIGYVGLNRPEAINALNKELWYGIGDAIQEMSHNPDVWAIVLYGEGEKGFCAGIDIAGFPEMAQIMADDKPETKVSGMEAVILKMQRAWHRIARVRQPVIVAIHGYCLGGAMELASYGDIRLASSDAVFALPEVELGISPDMGGCSRLPNVIGPGWTKQLAFSAEKIDAHTALRIGFVNELTEPGKVLARATELAQKIVSNAPLAVQAAKKSIDFVTFRHFGAEADTEAVNAAEVFASDDVMTGMMARMSRQTPEFKGS